MLCSKLIRDVFSNYAAFIDYLIVIGWRQNDSGGWLCPDCLRLITLVVKDGEK
jgi:hypothetical protein